MNIIRYKGINKSIPEKNSLEVRIKKETIPIWGNWKKLYGEDNI